jgi:ribosome maturation factor RimP
MGAGEYTLEVGTPGAERELTEHRHYVRATDRLVKFQLAESGELVARIIEVDDDGIDVEVPGVKGRKPTAKRLAFADVVKARVQVEFNRKNKNDEHVEDVEDVEDTENEEEA